MSPHLSALGVLTVTLAVFAPVPTAAADTPDVDRLQTWLESMERHYEAHPELKTTPSSGWNPYNRVKWFHEQRRTNGRYMTGGDLWRAWEAKQERLRELGPPARTTPAWFSLGPTNFSGRINDLEFDPQNNDILYAGASGGGLWKSTDHGVTWSPKSDELPSIVVGAIGVLPWNGDVILLGTGTYSGEGVGILKSTDAGETWDTTGFTRFASTGHGFHVLRSNPTTQTILAGATDGLWRSTDEGETWIDVRADGNYFDVRWKPGDPSTVYTVKGADPLFAAGNNVKISTDDGLTWTKAGTGQPASADVGKSKLAVSPAEPEWIYALYSHRTSRDMLGMYRSTDGGGTWRLRNDIQNIPGGQGHHNLCLVVDPEDASLVIAGGVALFRSTNGGVTFVTGPFGEDYPHADKHDLLYEPGLNNTIWVATDGGVWKSTDDGLTYAGHNTNLVTYQFYDICLNNSPGGVYYAMGGTQDQGTDKWSGTTTWEQGMGGAAGADGMVCLIDRQTGTTVYAEKQWGDKWRNETSGTGDWTWIGNYPGDKPWIGKWDADANDGKHLYTHSNQGVFRSWDGGDSWTHVATHHAGRWIDIHDLDGSRVWTAANPTGDHVWVTTDDGATWTQAAPYGVPTGSPTKIQAHPTDLNTAFVTFSGYGEGTVHVMMTDDLGASWTNVTGDLPGQPVNAIAIDPASTDPPFPETWYIGTDTGVWYSIDGGTTWRPTDRSLPNAVVNDLEIAIHHRKLVAGTYGRGMWEVNLQATDVAVGEPQVSTPRNLMLDPPAPNPVTDRTMLRWAARHDGPVSLEIFDVRGRRVLELETLSSGDGIIRTTPWFPDGRPAGVYFAVVRAGTETISRKVIVTR